MVPVSDQHRCQRAHEAVDSAAERPVLPDAHTRTPHAPPVEDDAALAAPESARSAATGGPYALDGTRALAGLTRLTRPATTGD
jgi:hypothetical protein